MNTHFSNCFHLCAPCNVCECKLKKLHG